jgi:hypothetical protein
MPADPLFRVMREAIIGDVVGPTLPTVTVLTVPAAGGVKEVTRVNVVGV